MTNRKRTQTLIEKTANRIVDTVCDWAIFDSIEISDKTALLRLGNATVNVIVAKSGEPQIFITTGTGGEEKIITSVRNASTINIVQLVDIANRQPKPEPSSGSPVLPEEKGSPEEEGEPEPQTINPNNGTQTLNLIDARLSHLKTNRLSYQNMIAQIGTPFTTRQTAQTLLDHTNVEIEVLTEIRRTLTRKPKFPTGKPAQPEKGSPEGWGSVEEGGWEPEEEEKGETFSIAQTENFNQVWGSPNPQLETLCAQILKLLEEEGLTIVGFGSGETGEGQPYNEYALHVSTDETLQILITQIEEGIYSFTGSVGCAIVEGWRFNVAQQVYDLVGGLIYPQEGGSQADDLELEFDLWEPEEGSPEEGGSGLAGLDWSFLDRIL